ncbi:ABC transporter ATP-binding protein [Alkaliphilus peptidifermentans]|uniref:Dipeptide transport system ATP-binding protein n=1 Tax=Alkaliphilus peptidifermentans DSM 18978 TaxID=1120976 RepID=A0A1G5JMT4_9FIRM|nr:ATP-binding cassette domain-containing protein [Alkaliphilus peptidifermentans]SCY89018.1 dipeptide transport system ATP-binding protein [Alkaliphilus peptidifermentans DSM 18978]
MMLLEVKRLHKRYKKSKEEIIKDLNLKIEEGKAIGLLGETGCGKTTLAKLIVGLEAPDYGDVLLNNQSLPVFSKRSFNCCAAIQYIFQDPYSSLDVDCSIEEVLMEPVKLCRKNGRENIINPQAAMELIGIKNYEEWRKKKIVTLSGGQRQKIAIARAIIPKPKLIIADECTSMLDSTSAKEILEIFKLLKYQFNMSFLVITHQLLIIEGICDDIYVLKDGCVIEEGKAEDILTKAKSSYVKELIESMKLFVEGKGYEDSPCRS